MTVGLFERTFHAGVDHAAFSATRHLGVAAATDLVAKGYGDLHLFSFLSFTIMFGTEVLSIVGTIGLCVALMPLGIRVLAEQPKLTRRQVLIAVPAAVGLVALAVVSSLG